MKMKKRIPLIIAASFVLLASISASAQPQNIGKFETWTKAFSRAHQLSEVTHLRQVRADSQNWFDRVVFEFDGLVPNYNIKYLASRFYEDEGGKHRIKIAGAAFLQVELFVIPYDERQDEFAQRKGFYPKGNLKLPSLREIEDKGQFEGFYNFLLGISSRGVFRVSELSNPARLVIDLRH
jgi:hypothetical protein